MVARLVHPQAVCLEIGGDGELRRGELVGLSQRGNQFGGKKVRVDDDVPRFGFEKPQEARHVQLLERQAEAIAFPLRRSGTIHQVVKIPEDVRGLIHEVEVRLAIQSAKGGVRELEHVDVLDLRARVKLSQGELDRLGRSQMSCSHRRG